ncbi:MAG: hypothetical protein KJ063_21210 [Anaerolineae bacterium]|nr:hypothetical protein [Anaerolineae bacterium]
MKLINRGAIVVRVKQPFIDWLNQLPDTTTPYTADDFKEDCTVLLIPDFPSLEEMEAFINPLKPDLFEEELLNYSDNPRLWPDDLTARRFDAWFDLEVHSIVYDAAATPIVVEEDNEDEDEDTW